MSIFQDKTKDRKELCHDMKQVTKETSNRWKPENRRKPENNNLQTYTERDDKGNKQPKRNKHG